MQRPSGTPSAGVVPSAGNQPPVPGEQHCRGHREHLAPPAAGDQPQQCREPQSVGRLVTDPADLAAQHSVLVPDHQELSILGHLPPGQYRQATQQAAYKQVDDRNDHSAMIPAHQSGQAQSSNRAPQGRLVQFGPIGLDQPSEPLPIWLRSAIAAGSSPATRLFIQSAVRLASGQDISGHGYRRGHSLGCAGAGLVLAGRRTRVRPAAA